MIDNGYMKCVANAINKYKIGDPILVADLTNTLALEYNIQQDKAKAAVCVCLKRIVERNTIPNLRRFEKGIYCLTRQTAFGETKIDMEKLIELKYILPDNGYETGPLLLHKLGLTTLIPNVRQIATNKAIDNTRDDKRLNIVLKKPKMVVNKDNKRYLQLLDVLEYMDKIPVDAKEPYNILNGFVRQYQLGFGKLLALGNRHYPCKVIQEIAQIAEKGLLLT